MIIGQLTSERLVLVIVTASLCLSFHAVSSLQAGGGHHKPVDCSNINEVIEKCGANASYSHTVTWGAAYPSTFDDLKVSCPKIQDGLACIRRHLKCLHSLTRRAMLAFIDSRRNHYKSICGNIKSQDTKSFVEAFACINKHKRKQAREQEILSIRQMDAILSSQVTDFKERFQRSCCAIIDYRRRSINDLEPQCANPNYVAAVENVIESVVGQAVEFACPDPKSGICKSFSPLKLDFGPVNKTLTKAGTDLLMVLTAPDEKDNITIKPRNG